MSLYLLANSIASVVVVPKTEENEEQVEQTEGVVAEAQTEAPATEAPELQPEA